MSHYLKDTAVKQKIHEANKRISKGARAVLDSFVGTALECAIRQYNGSSSQIDETVMGRAIVAASKIFS